MRRILAASVTLALALAGLSGCGTPRGPIDEIFCNEGERFILVQVAINRFPPADAPDDASVVRSPVQVTVESWAHSEFSGVRYEGHLGIGISGQPETFEATTPYVAKACWPDDAATALSVRAEWPAHRAGDELECTFEDGWKALDWNVEDLVAYDHRSAELTDLMPTSAPLVVQCDDYYMPEGYRGPELRRFPAPR